ncbi:MAG: hypothetical protein HOP11_03750 [Saprospiraceae bacterium]|nr:hypothetical protein [Saprospiraceae bacterium]
MTLQQLFDFVQQNPSYCAYLLAGVPVLSLILAWISEPYGYKEPWNYFFSVLVYAACIPGIFAVTLNIYFFFWERGSIMNAELLIRFVPILTMLATLFIISRFVSFDAIPGFDKLSGLMLIIGVILTLMWVLDRTHIYAFTRLPFYFIIFLIVGSVLLIRLSAKKLLT